MASGLRGGRDRAALRDRLRELFESSSLQVVIFGTIDSKRAERLAARIEGRSRQSIRGRALNELAAVLAGAFFARDEVAGDLIREMDRATQVQRSLVTSIPGEEVEEKVGSLDALRFRRHSAKFLWAIARDERPEVWPLAGKVLGSFLEQNKRLDEARGGARRKGAEEEIKAIEGFYEVATRRAELLEAEVSSGERERARLVAEAGAREASLRREVEARQEMAAELSRLEKLGNPQVGPPPSKEAKGEEASRRKLRKLEKRLATVERERDELGAAADRVVLLEEENARLRGTIDGLRDLRAREKRPAPASMAPEETAPGVPLVQSPSMLRAKKSRAEGGIRVGVFVDVANLAGAARRLYNGSVDYRLLLERLLGGRRLSEARAYAIDKGGSGYKAFAHSLREAGYKVFTRKPKRFPDGTVKADWDVGMAVQIVELADKLDVVVLGTGDGDFKPVVSSLKKQGVEVELAAFSERTASELKKAVDRFLPLDGSLLET